MGVCPRPIHIIHRLIEASTIPCNTPQLSGPAPPCSSHLQAPVMVRCSWAQRHSSLRRAAAPGSPDCNRRQQGAPGAAMLPPLLPSQPAAPAAPAPGSPATDVLMLRLPAAPAAWLAGKPAADALPARDTLPGLLACMTADDLPSMDNLGEAEPALAPATGRSAGKPLPAAVPAPAVLLAALLPGL
jgi:hypothetical protein